MSGPAQPIIYLPGAGGGPPDPRMLGEHEAAARLQAVEYPCWQRYLTERFSPEGLIEELADCIQRRVPNGPICIIGTSIGGHFGYAAALRLVAAGREIGGLCAIDSFMVDSASPGPAWKRRALQEVLYLIRKRRGADLGRLLRSKFWRALVRLPRGRLPDLLRPWRTSRRFSSLLAWDPLFEEELTTRLLLRNTVSWIGALDRDPVVLRAPVHLIRTPANAKDDDAWRRRCSDLRIQEVTGGHHTLLESENVTGLRKALDEVLRGW